VAIGRGFDLSDLYILLFLSMHQDASFVFSPRKKCHKIKNYFKPQPSLDKIRPRHEHSRHYDQEYAYASMLVNMAMHIHGSISPSNRIIIVIIMRYIDDDYPCPVHASDNAGSSNSSSICKLAVLK
jgi:hypothetical protein